MANEGEDHTHKLLLDILRAAIGTLRLDEMLSGLVENVGQVFHADGAYITRWDEERKLTFHAAAYGPYRAIYPALSPTPPDQPTITRAVLEAGHPIAVFDVHDSPHTRPAFVSQFETRSVLGLPLIAHGRRLGALLIASNTPRHFTPAEIELGGTAADLVALAIDNARLREAEERQRRQAETMRQVTASLTSSLEQDTVLDSMLDQLSQVVAYDSASIQLLRLGGLEIVAARGFPDLEHAKRIARRAGVNPPQVQRMIEQRRAIAVPDTRSDRDWNTFTGLEYIRSWIGAPLLQRDELIGVLYLDHRQPNAYGEEQAEWVTAFAHQAAIAITNAQLYQEERERVTHLAVLNDIVRIASSTLDLDEVYQALAANMVRVLGGDGCSITRWDEETQRSTVVASRGVFSSMSLPLEIPASTVTLTKSALEAGRPIAVDDVFNSPYSDPDIARLFPARSKLALPLIADGRRLGAVLIQFLEPHHFSEEEIARAARAAELVAVAVAKAMLHDELRRHAQQLASEVAARTQELRAANEQLRSLDRLKSRLITHLGHELRTPVANLGTYLHLLASGRPEKRTEYLQTLNAQCDLLRRIIESVTAFAEVDLAPEARPAHPWALAQVVDPVVIHWMTDASAKSLWLDLDRSGLGLKVLANPQRVGRALDEILSNAISYTDAGGSITIRAEKVLGDEKHWACISVSDTGIGIPADELPHVFDQFFRGSQRALQVRGIGLGLSLVQAIAEVEGGRVTAESDGLGKGSTFRLWLHI